MIRVPPVREQALWQLSPEKGPDGPRLTAGCRLQRLVRPGQQSVTGECSREEWSRRSRH